MQEFVQFVISNWWLWLALVIIVILLVYEETKTKVRGVQRLGPQQIVDLMNRQKAVIVDLRDKATYSDGHIIGALSIPKGDLEQSLRRLEKFKNRPLVLVCSTGRDNIAAGAKLIKQGFASVYGLQGGISAWKNANLPLEKGN